MDDPPQRTVGIECFDSDCIVIDQNLFYQQFQEFSLLIDVTGFGRYLILPDKRVN